MTEYTEDDLYRFCGSRVTIDCGDSQFSPLNGKELVGDFDYAGNGAFKFVISENEVAFLYPDEILWIEFG